MRRPLLLALLLTACTYREAMQRGHSAAEARDWAAAVQAYEAALQADPEDERAQAALAEARQQWKAEALGRFRAAHAAGDLAAAEAALTALQAAAPGSETTRTAHEALAAARAEREATRLRTEAEKSNQSGDLRGAWRYAAAAERTHSTAAGQALLARYREALMAQARAAEGAGRWREGLSAWEALAGEDAGLVAEQVAYRGRWADQERARAEAASAHPATAFLHFAMAAHLAQRPDDAARRDALRRALLAEVVPVAAVEVAGAAERATRLQAATDALPSPGAGPRSPRQVVRIDPAPPACAERRQARAAEGTYIAGVQEVPNPDWQRAREEAARRRSDLRRAEDEAQRAQTRLREAEARAERAAREHWERHRRERERATDTLDRARDGEQRAQEALRRAHERRDEAEVRRCQSDLERARQDVERAWRAVDELAAGARHFDAHAERDRARSEADRADAARREAQERLDQAERHLDGLSPLRTETRYATHRYPIYQWTRTCRGTARLELRLADLPPHVEVIEAAAAARDDAHDIQLPLGLSEDPLQFPESDARLIERLDAELGARIAERVDAQRQAWARALADRALAAAGPEATRLGVAALLLDRRRLPPPLVQRLVDEHDLFDPAAIWAEGSGPR